MSSDMEHAPERGAPPSRKGDPDGVGVTTAILSVGRTDPRLLRGDRVAVLLVVLLRIIINIFHLFGDSYALCLQRILFIFVGQLFTFFASKARSESPHSFPWYRAAGGPKLKQIRKIRFRKSAAYGFSSLNIAISLSKRLTISSSCGCSRWMMSATYSLIGLLSGPIPLTSVERMR